MTTANAQLIPNSLWVSYHTAKGPRPSNEDWLGGYLSAEPRWQAAKGGCFVVADGFGGHRAGEIASRVAGETVLTAYFHSPISVLAHELATSVLAANCRVSELAAQYSGLRGMASTVVAVAVRGAEAAVAHMGDSRAYLWRQRTLYALTKDHSWVQRLVDGRVISPAEAAAHPYRNIVTRYAGMGAAGAPDVRQFHLQAGDALLLCSDGLTDRVPAAELGALIDGPLVRDPAPLLTRRAAKLGARDNASAIVLRYLPVAAPSPAGYYPAHAAATGATGESLLPAFLFGGALAIGAAAFGALLAALLL